VSFFLGIDTSNYTTSAAVSENGKIIKNEKIPLPVKDGDRGLRQSDAVFSHIKNLPALMEKIGHYDFSAVGYSAFPRDAIGSYMPCFEVGAATAISVASICGLPLFKFSHQRGHIMAALYSAGCVDLYEKEFLAFHVSGGTTELLHIKDKTISLIGQTLDLNAGQLVDRVGVLLGMHFPCGAELEKLALSYEGKPVKPKICVKNLDCNLSGAENKASAMISEGKKSEAALYTLEYIKYTLAAMTENALKIYGYLPVLFAGGVMSNSIIRNYICDKFDAYFAEPRFSCDNAAGTALLTEMSFKNKI